MQTQILKEEKRHGRVQTKPSPLERLRELILHPHLQSGALKGLKDAVLTSERAIAEELQISRTPVREALAVLEQLSIVEQIPQVGVKVHEISIEEVEGVLQIREGIETSAVRRLARSDSRESGIAELKSVIADMNAVKRDVHAFMETDTMFHCSIVRLSGLGPHVGIMQSLRDRIHLYRLQQQHGELTDGEMTSVIEEHSQIVNSLSADRGEAEKAIEAHLANTLERLRHLSQSQNFATTARGEVKAEPTKREEGKMPSRGKVAAAAVR